MQVVQPYPTRLKPSASKSLFDAQLAPDTQSPLSSLGASEVFTHGLALQPQCIAAFFATKPAAIITYGFAGVGAAGDCGNHHIAMLQFIIVATMATATFWPRGVEPLFNVARMQGMAKAVAKPSFAALNAYTILWTFWPSERWLNGGPKSNSIVSVNTGSTLARIAPHALQLWHIHATSAMRSSLRHDW